MVQFVFSPEWFYGIDTIFEIFSVVVTLLISLYAFHFYKFSRNKNYMWFSLAFFMISLSFIFKILTNIVIYSEVLKNASLGTVTIITSTISASDFLYILGYLGYRMFFLLALLGIYAVTYKDTDIKDLLLFFYFFVIICVFSHYAFIVFHLTALLLLVLISNFFVNNYLKKNNTNTFLTGLSFICITLGQLFYILTYFSELHYVVAEVIQSIGFMLLLVVYIWVKK